MAKIKLIKFYANWCGPCQQMKPVIDELKKELGEKVEFEDVDVDKQEERAHKYNVLSIPTFVIEKDGKVIDSLVGLQTKENLKKKLGLE